MNAYINPCPFHTSIGDLLAHFHFHSIDARPGLLERDALWASENQALHTEINKLRADLAKRDEKERWLKLNCQTSEEKAESERMKSKRLEEKITEMEREVAQLKAEKVSVEGGLKEKMCVLVDRVLNLEKEKKTEIEKFEASERLWSANREAIRKADAGLILKGNVAQEELREKIGILEKKIAEIGSVLKVKMDLETRYKRLEKESNEKISELEKTVVVLQRENIALKTGIKILEEKMSELEKKAAGLELDIAKRDLTIGRHLKEKIYLEFQNKILEIEARAHREEKDSNKNTSRSYAGGGKEVKEDVYGKIKVLEKKKGILELKVDKRKNKNKKNKKKKRILKLVKTIEMLRDDKTVNTELIINLSSSLEKEKADKITQMVRVLEEKMALEELKICLEEEVEKKKTIFQLGKILKALQDDKRVEESENATEISGVLGEKMALEELKSYLKEESEKLKRDWEMQSRWVSELRGRNGMLEKEKTEMKDQTRNEKKYVSNQINKALETQKRLGGAQKQFLGFLETIMVLEREKEALSEKLSKFYIEMLEMIYIILNRNVAVEDYEKNNSELADRISFLEREKQGLEASIKEKDEVIKVLDKENGLLEDVQKELKKVTEVFASKLKVTYLTNNVGTVNTPWQNEGPNSGGVASSSGGVYNIGKSEAGMALTTARKRKRCIIKGEEKDTEMNNCSLRKNGSNKETQIIIDLTAE